MTPSSIDGGTGNLVTSSFMLGKVLSLARAIPIPCCHLGFPPGSSERAVLPLLCIQMVSPLVMVSLSGSGCGRGQNAERQRSHLLPGPATATQAWEGILAKSVGILTETGCQ